MNADKNRSVNLFLVDHSRRSSTPLSSRPWNRLALAAVAAVVAAFAQGDELARHRNLGKAFFENPTTAPQAVEEFRKALAVTGADRDRLNLGLALIKNGAQREAIEELERVQKSSPALPHTWFNLGILYNRAGRAEDAARQFEKLVELAPREPVAHHNLGVAYSRLGREPEAIRAFETAARLNPDFALRPPGYCSGAPQCSRNLATPRKPSGISWRQSKSPVARRD